MPSDNFFDIFHDIMCLCNVFFNKQFLDEISSLDKDDPYYEITKSSYDDYSCLINNPTYKLQILQSTLDSYKEFDDEN